MTTTNNNPQQVADRLPPVTCPGCHQPIEARPGRAVVATSYNTCLRQCPACGIGFSNARTADPTRLTVIRRDPLTNVPPEVRVGADLALRSALNEGNRENKWRKFGFSTSEDALTWTVFAHLEAAGQLRNTLAALHVDPAEQASTEPVLLIWGVPVGRLATEGAELRNRLRDVLLKEIGENPSRLSEPDVILDFGKRGVVVIEVKLKSGNAPQKQRQHGWAKYADNQAFRDYGVIQASGLYELARNWRLGCGLADRRPFTLINLAPSDLFRKEDRVLEQLAAGLNQDRSHRFVRIAWADFLSAMGPKPGWLDYFLRPRMQWLG